jgi:hypothetical protein
MRLFFKIQNQFIFTSQVNHSRIDIWCHTYLKKKEMLTDQNEMLSSSNMSPKSLKILIVFYNNLSQVFKNLSYIFLSNTLICIKQKSWIRNKNTASYNLKAVYSQEKYMQQQQLTKKSIFTYLMCKAYSLRKISGG